MGCFVRPRRNVHNHGSEYGDEGGLSKELNPKHRIRNCVVVVVVTEYWEVVSLTMISSVKMILAPFP